LPWPQSHQLPESPISEDDNPFINEEELQPNAEDDNMIEKERERKEIQTKLGKKQRLCIASWNTRGKNDSNHHSKWKTITRIMRLRKIAILAVQEARIKDKNEATKIEEETPRIKVISNGEFSNKLGTAFAINLDLIKANEEGIVILHKIIIPNRVAQLRIAWGEDQELNIINIYAPNNDAEKTEFFKDVKN